MLPNARARHDGADVIRGNILRCQDDRCETPAGPAIVDGREFGKYIERQKQSGWEITATARLCPACIAARAREERLTRSARRAQHQPSLERDLAESLGARGGDPVRLGDVEPIRHASISRSRWRPRHRSTAPRSSRATQERTEERHVKTSNPQGFRKAQHPRRALRQREAIEQLAAMVNP